MTDNDPRQFAHLVRATEKELGLANPYAERVELTSTDDDTGPEPYSDAHNAQLVRMVEEDMRKLSAMLAETVITARSRRAHAAPTKETRSSRFLDAFQQIDSTDPDADGEVSASHGYEDDGMVAL